jgi:hypothetical protein
MSKITNMTTMQNFEKKFDKFSIGRSYKCFKFHLVAQRYYKNKQKIIYLPNNNSEHFDVWSRSMANTYQRNKHDFIYRN